MALTCAGCGAEAPPEAAFCSRCGQRLPAPAPGLSPPGLAAAAAAAPVEADRRPVTVLFADLTGFTSLSERLDPEEVRAFQNALFATLAQAIEHAHGFVEKFVGDAVMAVFGAPVAHEDDPERALQAALDMHTRVRALEPAWGPRLGHGIALHIGVHTGPVVAGSLGVGAGQAYAVTGDTVNTTARLLSAAAPGTVLVSEATQRLAVHAFDFDAADELLLRGRTQPIRTFRLRGRRERPLAARGLAALGLAAPLVGRGHELDAVLAAFDRMQQGRAQCVSIVGEAGSGKSRLLGEVFQRLDADPRLAATAIRRTACNSLGEATYGIFGALFREGYRVEAGDSLSTARDKLNEGLSALGVPADEAATVAGVLDVVLGLSQAPQRDIDPEQMRRQIVLAARALLSWRLAQQPLLIVIEDFHWADQASAALLQDVVEHLADQRLMLLLAQRPDQPPWPAGRAETVRVDLRPLRAEDICRLVGQLLGLTPGATADAAAEGPLVAVQDFIVTRSGGNPFFVEELLRGLIERGALRRDAGGWVAEPVAQAGEVPATLHGLLLSRIDRLAAGTRRLLQAAAVLGMEFDAALLRQLAGDEAAEAGLPALRAADLLRCDDEAARSPRCRFTHALVHEVVYQNLLLARRTGLHERVGRLLEAGLDDRVDGPATAGAGADARADALRRPARLADLEALGHHWSLSPDKRRGARYLMAAGDWARAVYANDDAIRHYERALQTLAASGDGAAEGAEAKAARERLGDLLALAGRRAEAEACYDAVQRSAERDGDPTVAARIDRKLGGLHWDAGERARAAADFERGLARLGDGGDAIERAHLHQQMGRLAFRAGDSAAAVDWARHALCGVEAAGVAGADAVAVRAEALNTLGVALARIGRLQDAVAEIERSISLAEANDLQPAACRGYTNLAVLYATLDPPRAITTCLRGLQTAQRVGDLGFQSRLYANLAVAYCALTDRCEAEGIEAAQAAARLDRRLGLLDHLAVPLIVLGQIHQCHGDHARAFASYEEALALAEQAGEPQLLFPCYDGLATLYLDTGDAVRAEAWLAKAQALCARAGLEPDALMVLPFLC